MLWLLAGFLTSAITLHIATLLLLDEPSLLKAIAVAASVWLIESILVIAHVEGRLLYTAACLIVGCTVLKQLYGVGLGQALIVSLVHSLVAITIGALLWFAFPSLVRREHPTLHAAGPGPGCLVSRPWV